MIPVVSQIMMWVLSFVHQGHFFERLRRPPLPIVEHMCIRLTLFTFQAFPVFDSIHP